MSIFQKLSEWFEHLVECDDHYDVTVKKGDNLWTIAEEFTGDGLNWTKIAAANPEKHFTKNYVIQPGDVLHIPKS